MADMQYQILTPVPPDGELKWVTSLKEEYDKYKDCQNGTVTRMISVMPSIGKIYKIINGPYAGFIGKCVSYDLQNNLPLIIQDDNYNLRACKIEEVECADNGNDIQSKN